MKKKYKGRIREGRQKTFTAEMKFDEERNKLLIEKAELEKQCEEKDREIAWLRGRISGFNPRTV
jgi:hypothetical protein